ncbi:MAG: DUF305 domain-containing protein [Aeromicrobium sp.]
MRNKTILAASLVALALVIAGCGSKSNSTEITFNKSDVTFAQEMIPHHQQAVEMADLADTRATSPEVKALAAKIKDAQGPEIKTMTGWLKSWNKDVPTSMSGMDHGSSDMPGMMTADEMAKLQGTSGADFDRQFLTMMIAHHQGAITMAKTEQNDGKYVPAVSLAEKIQQAQTAEIKTMQTILAS